MARRFAAISTGTLSDVMDSLGIPAVLTGIRAVTSNAKIVGSAVTVKEVSGTLGAYPQSDFGVGEIIDEADRGDVVVVDNDGQRISTWGFLASFSSKVKGIAGVVVDGGVRDLQQINGINFPVFARHVVPLSGKRRIKIESINRAISIKNVKIEPKDIVVGDDTGIVVIPAKVSSQVLEQAESLERLEQEYMPLLKSGVSLSELVKKHSHL
jgi:regulator of RNase E activity RraA